MKFKTLAFSSMCLLFIDGCATSRAPTTLEAVGPLRVTTKPHRTGEGVLTVYSDRINNPNDPSHAPHGDYKVYSMQGTLLQTVNNRTGSFNLDPVALPLRAGQYKVVANAVNYGPVTVPVTIAENKNTVVDLDQEFWTQDPTGDHRWVRLPNHHVVGEKAE